MDARTPVNNATDDTKRFAAKPLPWTLEQAAWTTPPTHLVDTEGMIDVPRMRRNRQNRLREQMKAMVDEYCGGETRTGVERTAPLPHQELEKQDLTLADAAKALAHARKIKCPEEILCMNQTMAVAEDGMTRMRNNLDNGITEQELWSHMRSANIEGGGEWIDYRLLASGERTNPWQQVASSRTIRAGDLAVFDCGMVGPWSHGADIGRAYPCMMPDLGMADEYQVIYYPADERFHYDGTLEPGKVICVESCVGKLGGHEGVKLEDQYLIAATGAVCLSRYPFEDALLSREI